MVKIQLTELQRLNTLTAIENEIANLEVSILVMSIKAKYYGNDLVEFSINTIRNQINSLKAVVVSLDGGL